MPPPMKPPRPGGLHLPDKAVETLDLRIGAAEVGRLVVDGGAQLPLLVVETPHVGLEGLALLPQGRQIAVQGVVAVLQPVALASQLLMGLGEGGEIGAQSREV